VIWADEVPDKHQVSLTRRLQAINDGEVNHTKYLLEELYNSRHFSGLKYV
jgi:hypothetical protein